ncbi:MAG: hypothetical protein HZC50_09615 [Nitrospirae bacterium]|nr:hypothetical protein [Nitrospirota bacterium]
MGSKILKIVSLQLYLSPWRQFHTVPSSWGLAGERKGRSREDDSITPGISRRLAIPDVSVFHRFCNFTRLSRRDSTRHDFPDDSGQYGRHLATGHSPDNIH